MTRSSLFKYARFVSNKPIKQYENTASIARLLVEIPDALDRDLEIRCAELRTTKKALVTDAIRAFLARN